MMDFIPNRKRVRYDSEQVRDAVAALKGTLVGLSDAHYAAIEEVLTKELRYCRALAYDQGILAGLGGKVAHAAADLEKREGEFRDKWEPIIEEPATRRGRRRR